VNLADLARQLASARAQASVLDAGFWLDSVTNVECGYRVQAQLAQLAGNDVRGWKVTALSPEQQRGYSATQPVAGALLGPYVHASPVTLSLARFVTPLLECEVAFVLGQDLPARTEPYGSEEIRAAIEAVVPAMEIADCRLPAEAPDLLKLADSMGNGAFIVGQPLTHWKMLDLSGLAVTLSHDGIEVEYGTSARILGNPLFAVIALANAQPLPTGGLKRGQFVTTGTCTTPIPPRPGHYVGHFGALGALALDIIP
jgi:2-keto-4-pentenoate hydratase